MKTDFKRYDVTPFSSVREMMEIAVKEDAQTIAFRYRIPGDQNTIIDVTYNEFNELTENLGAALTARGFGKSFVACIGPNSFNWLVTYITAMKGAGVFVPIDRDLPESDVFNILSESSPEVLFFSSAHEKLFEGKEETISHVKLFVGLDSKVKGNFKNYININDLIKEGETIARDDYDNTRRDVDDMATLVYTSGTTGIAKGVMLSERNVCSCVFHTMRISTLYDTCIQVLPLHHTFGSVGVLCSLHLHTTICINENIRNVLKDMQTFRPSYIYLVPRFAEIFYSNIINKIQQKGIEKKFNLLVKVSNALRKVGIDLRHVFFKEILNNFGGRMKKIVTGGAPIRPDIGDFFDSIGIPLVNGYGITECSPVICANNEICNDWNTAGVKLECIDWRIDAPNSEGIGEICVKGETVMLGYYKRPTETAEVIKDGWFYTGDYGYINKYNQLVITGRKKNIIVLNNGKNIYPEEIEGYIGRIEYIAEVVVRGLKNEYGEDYGLIAELYLGEGVEKSVEKIMSEIRFVLRELPTYKNISNIIIRKEAFPKTTTAKIRRDA